MRKICVVVHSRANYGRIKTLMRAVDKHPDLELQLLVGSSALLHRFGSVIDIIRKDGFSETAVVYSILEGETPTTMAKSTGLAITELATLFENLKPDIVVTVADRFETLATAVAASYMNIPVAHTQGGEVTGSIDESVRHAITKLSHIHFPATMRAKEFLLRMGEIPDTVHLTGCPAIDVVVGLDMTLAPDFFEKYKGVGDDLSVEKDYIVVLQHPVTTEYGSGLAQINQTLKAVKQFSDKGMQVVWLWPNVDAGSDDIAKGIRVFRERHDASNMHFFINFEPEDYVRLIANSKCLVGNSSSGLREGAFLGTPCVNIGSRQAGRERASNVLDVDYDAEKISSAIERQLSHGTYPSSTLVGDGTAGQKIADILATCTIKLQKELSYINEADE
ncbi:UDP-N-acetylglucosamine 2-epimerase [Solemya velum gill symbiont]|uniref:UDP-N-acetyl-D-glucosamine 2-epimerase, UDP-hydrolysing n=1 Tax=Solemya velum gill symbiont TaxID=2340 RepID=A0A1T2DC13_SOVGS|nr:UDP-N-acetylglucosamine 2-epimerase [Solemya velum gill symbiont]OOY34302.1 UDP-N-acetyl-D-glucosamine 2-epimerase, UDP-hydrolysing [Solemya velum gill symbiont]OOY36952.1 UDP-N-acetyl-D-glucosamine 2-epimerase, UDP-hydrolysing [Solemya velum gill symbiont]OOY40653.1 UDP-N-acetyl-D-glucosamine 2-epimerase, UDP-hydrolysing [Solemya velum gill symbiont]OOY44593.1 UDP-N-acetyl-D-glucosamine 2-epimerase, UDP-hydrolysing [Solemya velum gill symbiont]OOY45816.1 UDP-N-acetyl-D-glucosamine 2-epimer